MFNDIDADFSFMIYPIISPIIFAVTFFGYMIFVKNKSHIVVYSGIITTVVTIMTIVFVYLFIFNVVRFNYALLIFYDVMIGIAPLFIILMLLFYLGSKIQHLLKSSK